MPWPGEITTTPAIPNSFPEDFFISRSNKRKVVTPDLWIPLQIMLYVPFEVIVVEWFGVLLCRNLEAHLVPLIELLWQ